ncbi:MAG: exodeoxyribonuclease VII large subunit [Oscillospiraceae bacterium]|jgi:exodeoxyribonuclease VII large subunit|nr:exodeoxyribonuclease VII large subunit [Oscillospiraceae bacterium]
MAKVYGVGEINNYIKAILDEDALLSSIYVRGELSNYKTYPSGHHYFTMKDADGAMPCVMFKSSADKLKFKPENGMSVIALGRIAVYPRDGKYQMYVSGMTSDGAGDLYVEYERLKAKLDDEGLFDPAHKQAIPRFPATVAVITSSAGAAVRDIIRVLGARYPLAKVVVLPVRVQGVEAPPEIVSALKFANRHRVADVIIAGRGGGSIEDLWAFNDERVARAIYASAIPVISAVGHEPDFTIADFVADLRAATPSNAAELAVPDIADMRAVLQSTQARASSAVTRAITQRRERVESYAKRRVLQSPRYYVDDKRLTLDHAQQRLVSAANTRLHGAQKRFAAMAATLDAISPLKVLGRGYAVARKLDGTVLRARTEVESGEKIVVRLQKDEITATVD